jgi:DNA-directed RNA polymerase specialized sigma24 family protein
MSAKSGSKQVWSMKDEEARADLVARVRRAAHKICRGPDDYEDTVQDMLLTILEAQAEDPAFAEQAPSYQVKRAWWRVRDKRRLDDREARHLHLDIPIQQHVTGPAAGANGAPANGADWYEMIEGSGPADQDVILGLTRAGVRTAIENLAAGPDDVRGSLRRDIIVRRFYGEQTVAEAAAALGIPKGTGCMYSAQALKQLRTSLAAWA